MEKAVQELSQNFNNYEVVEDHSEEEVASN